jgi:lysophospholipase L1-like esterase
MDATVVNIANPGMPVEDALPGGVAGFGIDEALAESPDAIIMAFPIGNDLSRNVPNCNQATTPERVSCALTIYAENLIQLIKAADDAGVPVWVTTTQPQVAWLTPTDPLPPDLDMLAASKESMTMLAGGFAGIAGADAVTFGTIDFWTPLQAPPPNPEENADPNLIVTLGVDDNGHPNIAGHTKLTEAVIAADIPGNL